MLNLKARILTLLAGDNATFLVLGLVLLAAIYLVSKIDLTDWLKAPLLVLLVLGLLALPVSWIVTFLRKGGRIEEKQASLTVQVAERSVKFLDLPAAILNDPANRRWLTHFVKAAVMGATPLPPPYGVVVGSPANTAGLRELSQEEREAIEREDRKRLEESIEPIKRTLDQLEGEIEEGNP